MYRYTQYLIVRLHALKSYSLASFILVFVCFLFIILFSFFRFFGDCSDSLITYRSIIGRFIFGQRFVNKQLPSMWKVFVELIGPSSTRRQRVDSYRPRGPPTTNRMRTPCAQWGSTLELRVLSCYYCCSLFII